MNRFLQLLFTLALLVSSGTALAQGDAPVRELDWMELLPPIEEVENLLDIKGIDNLSDDDPRAQELLEQWQKNAPVVEALDGERVKIPGFVVPLEMETKAIREFLLVPYFGACIHVPPPPSNQIIHVQLPPDNPYQGGQFDTVWVTGTLHVEQFSSDLGDAGYRIESSVIEPYTEDGQ